jgi:hypothetical protein
MNRDEMLGLRNDLRALHEKRTALGDFDANSADIRKLTSSMFKLTQHLLDRMKKP